MTQNFESNRERAATVSDDFSGIQAGWTVYDALERPIGNVTDVEGGHLGIDGRPEGLGQFAVPLDAVREVRDGSVHLNRELERLATSEPPAGSGRGPSGRETIGEAPSAPGATSRTTYVPSGHTAPRGAQAGEARAPARDETHGSSYTASGTPVGLGSNTPVGDEPDTFRAWDASPEGSPWSKLGWVAAPLGIGAASAAAYVWWHNRQARRGRLARLKRAFARAGDTVTPLAEVARERTSPWWLAPLAALPLAYYLRTSGERGVMDETVPRLRPDPDWRSRLPSAALALPDDVEVPPLWTAALPVAGAGLIAAWLAMRARGRPESGAARIRRIAAIMTRDVEVIGPDVSVFEAATRMRQLGVGFLPVCDGRRLQGVLTDRDIVVRSIAQSQDPQVATARSAMSSEVIYAFDDEPVARAAELMRQHQIRRLPIVDRGKNLVGVVSLGDLAVDAGSDRLSGQTLERISEPARPRR